MSISDLLEIGPLSIRDIETSISSRDRIWEIRYVHQFPSRTHTYLIFFKRAALIINDKDLQTLDKVLMGVLARGDVTPAFDFKTQTETIISNGVVTHFPVMCWNDKYENYGLTPWDKLSRLIGISTETTYYSYHLR